MSTRIDTRPFSAAAGPIVDGHRISRGSQDDIDATEERSHQQADEHGDHLIQQADGSHIVVNEHPVPQPEPVSINELGAMKYE